MNSQDFQINNAAYIYAQNHSPKWPRSSWRNSLKGGAWSLDNSCGYPKVFASCDPSIDRPRSVFDNKHLATSPEIASDDGVAEVMK